VATVERRNGRLVETLCGRNHGSINGPEWQVLVLMDELGNTQPITGSDWFDAEIATREISKKSDLGIRSQSRANEVDNFGYDQCGDEERLRVAE